ncbi:unnamed protein product [Heterobilharzia americana]|nr:unnamed protein product [Heterobilharzia americana]
MFLLSIAFQLLPLIVLGNQAKLTMEKKYLLHAHNYIRQTRSRCDYIWSTPADEELNNLVWDEGLAWTAQIHADKCINTPSEPRERTTCRWKSVGQNIAEVVNMKEATVKWKDGSRFYNLINDNCRQYKNYTIDCNSYKQIVNANTTHIGCAVNFCEHNTTNGKYMVVCNYAPA